MQMLLRESTITARNISKYWNPSKQGIHGMIQYGAKERTRMQQVTTSLRLKEDK